MTNEEMLTRMENAISNLIPLPQLQFEVHVTEHCNLNCRQCGHFSPLAEKMYLDIEKYAKDIERLSELFNGTMTSILLLGGEPLLHPQLTEIMAITRRAFPIGRIRIVTNGILLPKMSVRFWEACKKFDVEISPSEYPIKFDYAMWEKVIKDKGVKYKALAPSQGTMQKAYPICPGWDGEYDLSISNYLRCPNANHCITLRDGRMYTCYVAAHAWILKKYFHLDIHLSDKNSVNIYTVDSGDELLKKLARPIPFCQYCEVVAAGKEIECEWSVSKKDRYEWLAFEFRKVDYDYLRLKKPEIYVFGAGVWGRKTTALLQDEGFSINAVLVTRKDSEVDNVNGIPIVLTDELTNVSSNSICLVALASRSMKEEIYRMLSRLGFGDVVPVVGF